MTSPINLEDYVREAFDGVVADELDPFDYVASDVGRDEQQDAARHVIANELAARFGRGLTQAEMVRLTIDIAFEWQRRKENEQERVGMRAMLRDLNGDNAPSAVDRAALREAGR